MTSGGRKGASERWITTEMGILKRYGRVVRGKAPALKFAQYTMLFARVGRGERETIDDKTTALWVVQPSPDAHTAAAGNVLAAPQAAPGQAVLDIHAAPGRKFLSFQSVAPPNGEGIELGAIVRHNGGVTLESKQGDFAEWHRRAVDEAPFSEGDVVGFRGGRISRKTHNCGMLGVISRKAVVEGSAPPEGERHMYDTVAYSGVVPVKLSRRKAELGCDCPTPQNGQLLAPSGRNDGTAVLVPATESVSRVGILLDEYAALEKGGDSPDAAYRLVTAVIVAPTETVRTRGLANTSSMRKLALALTWGMVTVTCAVSFIRHLSVGLPPGVAGEKVCLPLSSTHNLTRLAEAGYSLKFPDADSVSRLGLECAECYSGTATLQCAGNRATFSEASGCKENSCSAPLEFGLGDGRNHAVIKTRRPIVRAYTVAVDPLAGKLLNGEPFWRTPVVHVAELGLGCAAGLTGVASAKCLVDQGNFSDFAGCNTKDVCSVYSDLEPDPLSPRTGTMYENVLECQTVTNAFTLDAAANSNLCRQHEICEYCTMTSAGSYCTFGPQEYDDDDWWTDGGNDLVDLSRRPGATPPNFDPTFGVVARPEKWLDPRCGAGEYTTHAVTVVGMTDLFCSDCKAGQWQPFEYDPTTPQTRCYDCLEGQYTDQIKSTMCSICDVCKEGYVQDGACLLDQDTSCIRMTEEEQTAAAAAVAAAAAAPGGAERFRVGDKVQGVYGLLLCVTCVGDSRDWYPATVAEIYLNSTSGTTDYVLDWQMEEANFRRRPEIYVRRAPKWEGVSASAVIDTDGPRFAPKDGVAENV